MPAAARVLMPDMVGFSKLPQKLCHASRCQQVMTKTLSSSYQNHPRPMQVQCPFCFKKFTFRGGGIANHIWKSAYCRQKKQRVLSRILERKRTTSRVSHPDPRTLGTLAQTQMSASPSDDMTCGSGHGNPGRLSSPDSQDPFLSTPRKYRVQRDQETAGFVFPWKSKEEWELVHWLSSTQLSRGDIDNFLKLTWVRTADNVYSQKTHMQGLDTEAPYHTQFCACRSHVQHGKDHVGAAWMEIKNSDFTECADGATNTPQR